MSENKTQATDSSVSEFVNSLDDKQQSEDSFKLIDMFRQITGNEPVMWGSAIIGFGSTSLTYASGRKVDWMKTGFSPRAGKLSLYIMFDAKKLTSHFPNLGKYSTGKGCIYIKKLSDVDENELRKLISAAVKAGFGQPDRKDGKEKIINQTD